MWARENAYKKGEANMTAGKFCQWVNNELLPSHVLSSNFPRTISVRTANRWLHQLGFTPESHKKGSYVDGHEREDVVKSRGEFFNLIMDLKMSHKPPPPCSDEMAAVPGPDAESQKQLTLIYHDESIFNTNEGQSWMWATEDTPVIQPKTKGSGIMVSDFIEQHNGFLRLTDAEFAVAKAADPDMVQKAQALLEYGAEREGYWTAEKFMKNIKEAVKIAKHKYPTNSYTVCWIFDQSSICRRRSQCKPHGGAQSRMRDTVWARQVQKMVLADGTPKGMKMILEERGINTSSMKADDMRTVLSFHEDFRTEKTLVEKFLSDEGHKVVFLPKFHCELNPIERVWGQAKCYSRQYTNYTLVQLRNIINPALNSVSADLIRKYFRKVGDYERAYIEGKKAGKEVESAVKVYKSHRRVFFESSNRNIFFYEHIFSLQFCSVYCCAVLCQIFLLLRNVEKSLPGGLSPDSP